MIILYIWSILGNRSFLKHIKYIPATVSSDFHYKNTCGCSGYDYSFYLNSRKYLRGTSKGEFIKGRKYLAAYDSLNPSSGKLLEIDITDSIYKVPENGWKLEDIPINIDTIFVKENSK